MSYALVFSRQAKETYAAIGAASIRFGESVLKKFERKTVKTIDMIVQTPLMFKAVDDRPDIRKGLIHKNCSVFYKVKANEIEILFFWDNRQEPIFSQKPDNPTTYNSQPKTTPSNTTRH